MDGSFWNRLSRLEAAAGADGLARELESWLNWALSAETAVLPKIPLRRCDLGGWAAHPEGVGGPDWADQWWATAFACISIDR